MAEARRILHCDMDCFYAQVHMRDDPSLRGLPVVVGGSPTGRGVVAAASYEARKFGIHSAMPAARAVRLCPQAVFLRPDFQRYHQESQQIFTILRAFTPLLQPVSLDEAYLDVSEQVAQWGSATAIAREIRRRVWQERGLTVSVGVGPNRLIAKIASDFHKPDGLTVVRPEQVQGFLDPLPVRRLHGVGPATEKTLHDWGIQTVADLRGRPLEELRGRFGKFGLGLYEYARGIDDRPVRTEWVRKSLGHERTYSQDLRALGLMDQALEQLAAKTWEDLVRKGLQARTLTVKVRYPDFKTLTRARSLGEPLRGSEQIAAIAKELLRQTAAADQGVRLLGVTTSSFQGVGLEGDEPPTAQEAVRQLSLFEAA